MTQTTAIGFFCHTDCMPTPDDMMRSYNVIEKIFKDLGVKPTYFSADDGVSRGGYKKAGGAFQRRVIEHHLSGYCSVGLAANPTGSDSPGYDNFLSMNFVFGPEAQEVYVVLTAEESILRVGTRICEEVVTEISGMWRWDYGFGFERDAHTMPGIYLVGGVSDRQDAEDRRRNEKWYSCYQPDERRKRIRDVFPYNMIGKTHLGQILPDGSSLENFIKDDPDSDITEIRSDLYLWKVVPDRTEIVRNKLSDTGIVISG